MTSRRSSRGLWWAESRFLQTRLQAAAALEAAPTRPCVHRGEVECWAPASLDHPARLLSVRGQAALGQEGQKDSRALQPRPGPGLPGGALQRHWLAPPSG